MNLIDPQNAKVIKTIQAAATRISAVAIHPEGNQLAVSISEGETQEILLIDISTVNLLRTIEVVQQYEYVADIYALAYSFDGQAIAVKTNPFMGDIQAWDINNGEWIQHPEQRTWYNANDIGATAYGHLLDVEYITKNDMSNGIKVADINTGVTLLSREPDKEEWNCSNLMKFTLSSDGHYLAIGCDAPFISVWNLKLQQREYELVGHEFVGGDGFFGNILDIAFSPYGYLLATAGYDATIRFWNASTGELLLTLRDHTCCVNDIAFSPDGRYLASASGDGTLRLWGLQP